jgi:hypothetical protein
VCNALLCVDSVRTLHNYELTQCVQCIILHWLNVCNALLCVDSVRTLHNYGLTQCVHCAMHAMTQCILDFWTLFFTLLENRVYSVLTQCTQSITPCWLSVRRKASLRVGSVYAKHHSVLAQCTPQSITPCWLSVRKASLRVDSVYAEHHSVLLALYESIDFFHVH